MVHVHVLRFSKTRISVDMSYFLKIAVMSPILSTQGLSTTALEQTRQSVWKQIEMHVHAWDDSDAYRTWSF